MDRRLLLAPLLAAVLSGCTHNIYQNTHWGMSQKALRAARPASRPLSAEMTTWFESAVIAGLKATVSYRLSERGLQSVTIVFDPVQMPKEQYLEKYQQVKSLLIEKYGIPEVEGADLAARAQKVRIVETPDHQKKCTFRAPSVQVELSCGGECDGSSLGNAIAVDYGAPRSRTDAL